MGKSYNWLLFILFSFKKKMTVLPLKKASKAKKKSVADVADVEETRTRSPELSQSDLARKKLSDLVVDGLMWRWRLNFAAEILNLSWKILFIFGWIFVLEVWIYMGNFHFLLVDIAVGGLYWWADATMVVCCRDLEFILENSFLPLGWIFVLEV